MTTEQRIMYVAIARALNTIAGGIKTPLSRPQLVRHAHLNRWAFLLPCTPL